LGNSHYRSSLRAKTGAEVITGFNRIATIGAIHATNMVLTGVASAPTVHGTTNVIAGTKLQTGNYIKIGTKYIITTGQSTAASINAAATLLLGTVPAGSIALGAGEFWVFSSDNSATMITIP